MESVHFFNQEKDLYITIFSELKNLGVKVPKLKKFKSNISKQEATVSERSCKIFGVSLSEQEWISDGEYPIPKFIALATEFLKKYVNKEIGLFRKAGNVARQKRLRDKIEKGDDIEDSDPNDVASLLKQWLRELPDPLIPSYLQELFLKCQNLDTEKNRVSACLLAFHLLPADHLNTLKYLLRFFSGIAVNCDRNKMGTYNLAVILAPNIFATREPVERSKNNLIFQHTAVIKTLIENSDKIGDLPPFSLQSSLQTSESHHSVDVLDINTSKFKRRISGPVQEIFSGFRKLVGQSGAVTPKTSSADDLLEVSTPRQAKSLDDLDASYATPKPKGGSNAHARRKSFGALLLRKKDKKKSDKHKIRIEPISLSLETNSSGEKEKHQTHESKSQLSLSLTHSLSVKSECKSSKKLTEVFQPTSKQFSIAPSCSENLSLVKSKKTTKWHVENISDSTQLDSSKSSVANEKMHTEASTSYKSGLSRQEAFNFKPNKIKPPIQIPEIKNIENNLKSKASAIEQNIVRQQVLSNTKCDKNNSAFPERKASREQAKEESISKRRPSSLKITNKSGNFLTKESARSFKASSRPKPSLLQTKSSSIPKTDQVSCESISPQSKESPRSFKASSRPKASNPLLMKSSSIPKTEEKTSENSSPQIKESTHSLKASSCPKITSPSLSKSSSFIPKTGEEISESSSPQSLDLSLSLLLHNFLLSPPKESPEIRVSIGITSSNSNSELKLSLQNLSQHGSGGRPKIPERMCKITENEPSESKLRCRLSSSSDSRIPRLKRIPDPQRPSSFSGRLAEFKPKYKNDKNPDGTLKRRSTKIPTFNFENLSPKDEDKSMNDSCFHTPKSSLDSDSSVSWTNGSKYLSALSTPDEDKANKRESIARILKHNPGHVQAKVSMFDSVSSSRSISSIDKLEGNIMRTSSEKFPSGMRYNRAKLTVSNSYDSVSRDDFAKNGRLFDKLSLQTFPKFNVRTMDTPSTKKTSSLERYKVNTTGDKYNSSTFDSSK